jgi:16S rRNA (adenine1518-N6/adenine1519-N6)-dimethyltransferase
MSRQRLGQHFLSDAGWRARIARAIGAASPGSGRGSAERVWLEIGAGHGEMTRLLAASGARVIAVELDHKLLQSLQSIEREFPLVEKIGGDILSLALDKITAGSRFSVYGNLPYSITSPILHRLFEYAASIEEIYIVIQLEVAARLTAHPGTRAYGYLSVLTQYHAKPEIALRIPRGAFRPPPKVTSALVHLRLPGERGSLGIQDEPRFFAFVKQCFGQKRKKLTNNLRSLAAPAVVEDALASAGARRDARAEQLSVAQFAELYRRLISAEWEG